MEWDNNRRSENAFIFLLTCFKRFYLPTIFPEFDTSTSLYKSFHGNVSLSNVIWQCEIYDSPLEFCRHYKNVKKKKLKANVLSINQYWLRSWRPACWQFKDFVHVVGADMILCKHLKAYGWNLCDWLLLLNICSIICMYFDGDFNSEWFLCKLFFPGYDFECTGLSCCCTVSYALARCSLDENLLFFFFQMWKISSVFTVSSVKRGVGQILSHF